MGAAELMLLYLDTMVFISAIEGLANDPAAECARQVLRLVAHRKLSAVTSELTLAEVLSFRSAEFGAEDRKLIRSTYETLLIDSGYVALLPVLRDHMFVAADLATSLSAKVRLPDRLHLAAALSANATYFMSLDRRLTPPAPLQKLGLDEAALTMLRTQGA